MNQTDDHTAPSALTEPADATAPISEATGAQTGAETEVTYTVVINDEAQYSIWPTFRAVPAGWTEVGVVGVKADCLAHIDRVWTDMRPASLRRFMDQ